MIDISVRPRKSPICGIGAEIRFHILMHSFLQIEIISLRKDRMMTSVQTPIVAGTSPPG